MIVRVVTFVAVVSACILGWDPARASAEAAALHTIAAHVAPPASGAPRVARQVAPSSGGAGVVALDSGQDIRDIHGPIATPSSRSAWWVAAEIGVLATGVVAFVLYARRRKPALRPDQRALRDLQEAGSLVGGDPRAFSFGVSETVRSYVEEAFNLRASHRTTDELLADLMQDSSPVASHRANLGDFLRYCDLAKFAAWSLSRAEMEAMLASAETFVRATAPEFLSNSARRARRGRQGVAVA
jgi:hypothetical protein